jgi:osmotically-inducible protein OsmY
MHATFKLIYLPAALMAVAALAACSRDESQTVGQSVDKAIGEIKADGQTAKIATQDAAKTMGVAAADAAITVKVNAALVADPRLKVMAVNVDTKDGRVSLVGAVPDAATSDMLTALVKAIDGVVEVDNQLRVEPRP